MNFYVQANIRYYNKPLSYIPSSKPRFVNLHPCRYFDRRLINNKTNFLPAVSQSDCISIYPDMNGTILALIMIIKITIIIMVIRISLFKPLKIIPIICLCLNQIINSIFIPKISIICTFP